MTELNILCSEVCRLATEVGDFLRVERQKLATVDSEAKGLHDYVTRFDRESERRIVQRLRELLPGSGFIAEEGTATRGAERYVWIVDPLDGTTNFIHGMAPTCVSIALYDWGENTADQSPKPLVGVVYEIWARECFYASADVEGAFLNGSPIQVSPAAAMNDSLIATGFPYSNFRRLPQYMNYLAWTMSHTHGVRRLGSAAADLVYVACGRADGFFEYGLKPYDVAAGAFIVQKAGGCNSDFHGGNDWLFGQQMVSAAPRLFDEMLRSLQEFMGE